jgi:2-keto-4-pentenoate hydratase/2-oxohepta-3-ene-1,7-dioic acid hydratase in catechol pathway
MSRSNQFFGELYFLEESLKTELNFMKSVIFSGNEVYPSKIICIGRNYVEHIEELNNEIPTEQVIFIKPNSSISNELSFNQNDAIHFEGEITFLVQSGSLAGIGFGLDLTKREVQSKLKSKGLPWERAKAFDKSAIFSEFVLFHGDFQGLRMELYINEVLVQKADYGLMLNKPDEILKEANSFLSFENGDLLMTGTPKGVGILNLGDKFLGKIFHNGQLQVESSWVVT